MLAVAGCQDEPLVDPVDPVVNPVIDTLVDPVIDPAIDTLIDPAIDTLIDPVIDTLIDPAIDTLIDPAIDTLIDPAIDTLIDPAIDTLVDPVIDPIIDTLIVPAIDTFNLENPSVRAFLDMAEERYNDKNLVTVSVVWQYCDNSTSNRKDIPSPVTLNWDKSKEGTQATIKVFRDSLMCEEVTTIATSADSVVIYNLIPGRTYYYKITEKGRVVKEDAFATTGRCRMLKISDAYGCGHANNCRDLGGLRTEDGRTLKYGLIYRGSNMDATTDAEKRRIVEDLGVSCDVDLRDGTPTAESTTSDSGISGCNQAFYDEKWDVDYVYAGFTSLDDLTNKTKLKRIFRGIIYTVKDGDACYIHCAAGADRTAFICMLLEAALGVPLSNCSVDYELTSFSVVGKRSRNGIYGDLLFSPGRRIIAQYGKGSFCENARQMLLDAGITEEQMKMLEDAMLE